MNRWEVYHIETFETESVHDTYDAAKDRARELGGRFDVSLAPSTLDERSPAHAERDAALIATGREFPGAVIEAQRWPK